MGRNQFVKLLFLHCQAKVLDIFHTKEMLFNKYQASNSFTFLKYKGDTYTIVVCIQLI